MHLQPDVVRENIPYNVDSRALLSQGVDLIEDHSRSYVDRVPTKVSHILVERVRVKHDMWLISTLPVR